VLPSIWLSRGLPVDAIAQPSQGDPFGSSPRTRREHKRPSPRYQAPGALTGSPHPGTCAAATVELTIELPTIQALYRLVIFSRNRPSLSHSLGRGPLRVRPSTWRYAVCPQALPLRGLPFAQLGRYLPCGCVRQSICSGTWPLSPLPPSCPLPSTLSDSLNLCWLSPAWTSDSGFPARAAFPCG
jgi:hypothetical protein